MNYLLIIAFVASVLNLAFNAYLYFTDKSISHVILGISYTAQSALKKADDAFALAKRLELDWIDAFENKSGVEFFKSELLVQGNIIKELKKELSESLANGDTVAEKIHDSLAMLHERQMNLTAKLNELEAYVTSPTTTALPEPNEAELKQEMEDSLVDEPKECNELCGINMCEENGCANRKRDYFDPPTADGTEAAPEPKPRKPRRNGTK